MTKTRLAVLGCGNMGSAIVLGLARRSRDFFFHAFDPSRGKAQKLARTAGGKSARTVKNLKDCDYFLLACKPQQFGDLAASLAGVVGRRSKIISVIAGVSSAKLRRDLGAVKIARVMPNTPALIGCGTCAIYFSGMNGREKSVVRRIFEAVAKVHIVSSDDKIDAATAMIGSGPAYVFEIARIFAEKFATMGFPKKEAEAIVKQVIHGSATLMLKSPDSPELLRDKVTSKKGTTWAALKVFKKRRLAQTLAEALQAAYKRAKALS